MAINEQPSEHETKQVSTIIAVACAIGLTICFVASTIEKADIPFYLYAIFGGGILGTDGIINIIKSVFRIN